MEPPADEAWIAVIGDRLDGHEPQDAIAPSVAHAASALSVRAPVVRWIGTGDLDAAGTALLDGAGAVWAAPGSPYASLDGALEGIRWARERGVPFLGTCAGFQHGVIEIARNVLGRRDAAHAEYGRDGELFIDELLCSLVGQTMSIDIGDDTVGSLYGSRTAQERYYCRFGLDPRWREPLEDVGLIAAATDSVDGDVRIMRLLGHPFLVLTLFVPQTSSAPGAPHPLIRELVRQLSP